jgi:hypothetical protein
MGSASCHTRRRLDNGASRDSFANRPGGIPDLARKLLVSTERGDRGVGSSRE